MGNIKLRQNEYNINQLTEKDKVKVYSESRNDIGVMSLETISEFVGAYNLIGSNYNGVLDAVALTEIPEQNPVNGDWYYVGVAGTLEGLTLDVHDIVKFNGTEWERVPRGVAVAANSRQTLLSSQTSIAAGAGLPVVNPDGKPGWHYENATGEKINWYFFGDTTYTANTLGDFGGMYAIVDLEEGYCYLQAYTLPTGAGDASWYKSRINWDDDSGQLLQNLTPGRYCIHTPGMDLSTVDNNLPKVELPLSTAFSAGLAQDNEEIWLLALATSSGFEAGFNKFTVEQVAYKFSEQTHIMDLVALPTLPAVGEAVVEPSDTKFWMSPVGNGGYQLASGGGFTLYAGPVAGSVQDVELTQAEAEASVNCRVFVDYTGMTPAERAAAAAPIYAKDTALLQEVQNFASAFFYTLDLSTFDIQMKMSVYGDALAAAAAGSVEVTAAALSYIIPYDPDEAAMVAELQAMLTNHLAKFPR